MASNHVAPQILATVALPANNLTVDMAQPVLVSFALDMNLGQLTLTELL